MAANEKRGGNWIGRSIYIIAALVFALIFAGALLPTGRGLMIKSAQTRLLSNAKQLGLGCQLYASDHEGKFPQKLADVTPAYIPDYKKLMFREPVEDNLWTKFLSALGIKRDTADDPPPREWSYYGAVPKLPNDGMLISSPVAYEGRRVIIYANQSGEFVSELEFQRKLITEIETRR